MGKIFTPEQRERLQHHMVDLVRKNGHMKMSKLADETRVSQETLRRYLIALSNLGEVYYAPPHGVFTTEGAFHEWEKQAITPVKKTKVIRKFAPQPDKAEVRAYDRHQNIICSECRNSEAMQRVLAFYRDGFQEATCEQMVQG